MTSTWVLAAADDSLDASSLMAILGFMDAIAGQVVGD